MAYYHQAEAVHAPGFHRQVSQIPCESGPPIVIVDLRAFGTALRSDVLNAFAGHGEEARTWVEVNTLYLQGTRVRLQCKHK